MGDADPPPGPAEAAGDGGAAPDLGALARDWIALWQSELAAAAVDREVQETWQRLLALWAGAATAFTRGFPGGGMSGDGRQPAGAPAAPRAETAAAASRAREAELERLARRVAELERRLADLERGGG